MKKHIEVVAAVITKEDKIFCAQRGPGGELAGKWEFPGGKIENNETKEEALVREIQEELKSEIKVKKHIMSVNHEYNTFKLTLHAYECELLRGDLILTEHLDSKWLSREELNLVDWAAADIPVVDKLRGD